MKRLLITLPLILFFIPIIWINAQTDLCVEDSVTTRETYSSSAIGQTMYYTVYTPPCYDANISNYPVIYLMHGSNDDDGQWGRLGLYDVFDEQIRTGVIPPIVAVMPFGNNIANENQFETFSWGYSFVNELMPDVESKYNISTQQDFRTIGGISRGGFWAYQIALTNPTLFSAVGGHSAFFDLYHAEPEDNPLDLILSVPEIDDIRFYLDRGIDDFAADGLDIMGERLLERDLNFSYIIHPEGQHNNAYWSQHVEDYLAFYTSTWIDSQESLSTETPSLFVTNTPSSTNVGSTINAPELLLPVVAFPSFETNISSETLQAIADGALNPDLILTPVIANSINPHPDTIIAEANSLRDILWQSRTSFSLLPLSDITLDYRILLVDGLSATAMGADYPFAGDTSRLSRVTLSGVTALTRNTRVAINDNSVEWAVEALQPYALQTDFFHMSNEVSFVEGCPNSNADTELLGGSSSFCSDPAHFEVFNLLDVDIMELTGNHNNDYGYQAYDNTFAWYQTNDISTIGGGNTLEQAQQEFTVNHNNNTIALLACNAAGPYYALVNEDESLLGGVRSGAMPCDWDWLETTIPMLATQADVLIVSVQYIEIEDYLPLPEQEQDFRRIANLGADVVIGSQAHKPQTFEFYPTQRGDTAFIHYGLGNLFFDQPFWGNQRFFLDTLYIYEGELRGIELYTGIIDDLARPRPMTADESFNFMFFMLNEQNGF